MKRRASIEQHANPTKKINGNEGDDSIYLKMIPKSGLYEKSYMHRGNLNFVSFAPKSNFLITTSVDGHLKIWKKSKNGGALEFVKHFKAHSGPICSIAISSNGSYLASTSSQDKSIKIFDVTNFDMINMIRLEECEPNVLCWIESEEKMFLLCSEMGSGNISLFDPEESAQTPLNVIKIHRQPVSTMTYLPHFNMVISSDVKGMVEYWSADLAATNEKNASYFPAKKVKFEMKSETDLFEFAKCKTRPSSIIPSSDNEFFVCTSLDRIVRIFNTRTGRLVKSFDETLDHQSEIHRKKGLWRRTRKSAENEEDSKETTLESLSAEDENLFELIPNMDDLEFGRRLALEKELEKNGHLAFESALFDEESGKFILYPTMFGIKVIRWRTGELVNIIGREEGGQRFLNVTLFQGSSSGGKRKDINEAASENPQFKQEALQSNIDPLVVCTAYKKSRFYIFSNSSPNLQERDVLNEKPEVESASGKHAKKDEAMSNLPSKAIIHTTKGDISIKLFPVYCPKTCLNFITLAKRGYYDNCIFHRVIPGFMIQTGDPTGTGTGGESIWGFDFEDEIHSALKHDSPYALSMANSGPNSNGSQFFITVVNCPWLDKAHTLFGRVTKGFEAVHNIERVKTNSDTNMPLDPVTIINIDIIEDDEEKQ